MYTSHDPIPPPKKSPIRVKNSLVQLLHCFLTFRSFLPEGHRRRLLFAWTLLLPLWRRCLPEMTVFSPILILNVMRLGVLSLDPALHCYWYVCSNFEKIWRLKVNCLRKRYKHTYSDFSTHTCTNRQKKRQKDRQANVQAYRQIDRHKYVDYMQYA